ncbi:hypothetical protein N9B46_00805 [Mariniblastus sp.]|nr:hypothetical protein [Mariniblastus sp.]MDA7925359.1 hypothetical protein [Mariniblastus sp.]MDB4458429.1 hypothetical protein [bacterium]MDB4564339.1 hypothetical protein [Mariniblastus sp.]
MEQNKKPKVQLVIPSISFGDAHFPNLGLDHENDGIATPAKL